MSSVSVLGMETEEGQARYLIFENDHPSHVLTQKNGLTPTILVKSRRSPVTKETKPSLVVAVDAIQLSSLLGDIRPERLTNQSEPKNVIVLVQRRFLANLTRSRRGLRV